MHPSEGKVRQHVNWRRATGTTGLRGDVEQALGGGLPLPRKIADAHQELIHRTRGLPALTDGPDDQ